MARSTVRHHEATAIAAFLRACDAGLGGKWFPAGYPGECALTHATIRPGHQIGSVGDGAFVRHEAVRIVSIRGNESIDDILGRFGWADPALAREWLDAGDAVLLFTASTLKPLCLRSKPRLGSVVIDKVSKLYWRSVAFMCRRVEVVS